MQDRHAGDVDECLGDEQVGVGEFTAPGAEQSQRVQDRAHRARALVGLLLKQLKLALASLHEVAATRCHWPRRVG